MFDGPAPLFLIDGNARGVGKGLLADVAAVGGGPHHSSRVARRRPAGTVQRVPLSPNKDAARQMLNDILRRVELERAGHRDPCAGHRKTPLAAHAADWLAVLTARGRGAEYVALKKARVDAVLTGCGFVTPPDLIPDKLERFLERLRTTGKRLSVQTTNDYLQAVSQFCVWMVENGRLETNPFASVRKGNAERDRRRVRRVLDLDELQRLIHTARTSERTIRGLTGPERAALYAVAATTGFRAGELAALVTAGFDLTADPPFAELSGDHTKNGKPACQPIPADVVAMMRPILASRPPGEPVWPGTWCDHPAYLIHTDAAAAGIPLSVDTKDGPELLDFHSLRGTYATFLDGLDISLKARQELMRHSDPRLTMTRYTRTRLHDLRAASDRFPAVTVGGPAAPELVTLKATGTDPRPVPLTLPLTLTRGSGRGRTGTGEETGPRAGAAAGTKEPPISQGFGGDLGLSRTVEAERAGHY